MTSPTRQSPKTSDYVANTRAASILRTKKRTAIGAGLAGGVADGALRDHVGDDKQAEEQDQRGGDDQLRGETAQAVVVTLFGGVASIWGPVIGAAILVPLAESLNAELGNILPGIQGVVYGAAIILIMLASPDGLYWTVRDRWFRRRALPEPERVIAVTHISRNKRYFPRANQTFRI